MSAGSTAGGNTTFVPNLGPPKRRKPTLRDHLRKRFKQSAGKVYRLNAGQAGGPSCYAAAWSGPTRGARGGTYWVNQRSGEKTYEDPTTGKAKAKQSVKAVGAAVGHAEHKISDALKTAMGKLPKPVQTIVASAWKGAMTGYTAGRKAAESAAVAAGANPATVAQIGKTLGMVDLLLSKGVFAGTLAAGGGAIAATAAAYTVPAASTAYLAFSVARNPKATLELAKKAIAKVRSIVRYEAGESWVEQVAKLAANSRNADTFLAVFAAAIDEAKGDPTAALEMVGQVFAKAGGGTQTYGRALVSLMQCRRGQPEQYAFKFRGPRSGNDRFVWRRQDLPKSIQQSGAYEETHAHEREKQAKESLPFKRVKRGLPRVKTAADLDSLKEQISNVRIEVLRYLGHHHGIKARSREELVYKLALKAQEVIQKREAKAKGGEGQPAEETPKQPPAEPKLPKLLDKLPKPEGSKDNLPSIKDALKAVIERKKAGQSKPAASDAKPMSEHSLEALHAAAMKRFEGKSTAAEHAAVVAELKRRNIGSLDRLEGLIKANASKPIQATVGSVKPAAPAAQPAPAPPAGPRQRQPHELPLATYLGQQMKAGKDVTNVGAEHRKAIEDALAAGKAVPPDVRAAYKDLAALPERLSMGNWSVPVVSHDQLKPGHDAVFSVNGGPAQEKMVVRVNRDSVTFHGMKPIPKASLKVGIATKDDAARQDNLGTAKGFDDVAKRLQKQSVAESQAAVKAQGTPAPAPAPKSDHSSIANEAASLRNSIPTMQDAPQRVSAMMDRVKALPLAGVKAVAAKFGLHVGDHKGKALDQIQAAYNAMLVTNMNRGVINRDERPSAERAEMAAAKTQAAPVAPAPAVQPTPAATEPMKRVMEPTRVMHRGRNINQPYHEAYKGFKVVKAAHDDYVIADRMGRIVAHGIDSPKHAQSVIDRMGGEKAPATQGKAPAPSALSKLKLPAPVAPAAQAGSVKDFLRLAAIRKRKAFAASPAEGAHAHPLEQAGGTWVKAMSDEFPGRLAATDHDNMFVKTKYGGPLADFIKQQRIGYWNGKHWVVDKNYSPMLTTFLRQNPQAYERRQKPVTYGEALMRMLRA